MSLYLRRPVVWSAVPEAFERVREPHCTILYSATLDPDIPLATYPMSIQVEGSRLFRPPHKQYVAGAYLLDDWRDELGSRNRWLLSEGATSDYPFRAHVTYHYAMPGETVAEPLPKKFWIVLGPEVASELPVQWNAEATQRDIAGYEHVQKEGFYP